MTEIRWTYFLDPRFNRVWKQETTTPERRRLIVDYKVATTTGPAQKAWLKEQFLLAPRIYQ